MTNIQFIVSDDGVLVTGKTFDVKDILKAKGAVWNPAKSAWFFPKTDVDTIRHSLQAEVDERMGQVKAQRKIELQAQKLHTKWLTTQEGRAHLAEKEKDKIRNALAQKLLGNYNFHWICCEQCEVIDWLRKSTYCLAHAEGGNAFRVRGSIFTGD